MRSKALVVLLSFSIFLGCSNGNNSSENAPAETTQSQDNVNSNNDSVNNDNNTTSLETTSTIEPFQGEIIFRNTGWGMNFDQVRASEEMSSVEGTEETGYLAYETTLNGTDAAIVYRFHNEALYMATYLLYPNNNQFIDEYNSLKKLLTEKYGEPLSDKKVFLDDLFRDDPSGWETAVSIGSLSYLSTWEKDETEVQLLLSGDNFESKLYIIYSSKTLSKEADEASREATKDNL